MDRNSGGRVSSIFGVGTVGQISSKAVFRTECCRYIDSQSQQGIYKVGMVAIFPMDYSRVVGYDSNAFFLKEGEVGFQLSIARTYLGGGARREYPQQGGEE